MIKKIILTLLAIIFCFSTIYAGTDMYLDYNGWCQQKEIQFRIYNKTDWNNKDEIERKLCDPVDKCYENECELQVNWQKDKCEPCDNCLYYHPIENAKITIYNGPMESRPILYETTSPKGEFKYTFESWNGYLIKVEPEKDKNGNPEQDYNDYEEIIEIQECNTNFEEPQEEKVQYFNHNFNYLNSEVLVTVTNTTMKNDTEISVRNDVIIPLKLNNSIKTIAVTSKNEEYNKIDIKIKFPNNPNAETKLFKYDSKNNNWNEISNYKKENSYLVLESGELGIYSITQKENPVIEQPVIEPIPEPELPEEENEIITENVPVNQEKETEIQTWQIAVLVMGVLAIGIILYMKFSGKKGNARTNYHDKRNEGAKTILTTYEQTYQETVKYVEKYKDDYSKDQIYRALTSSGVPSDVIDKVFNEKL